MAANEKLCVPWADEDEWETVRNQILSLDVKELIRGYETILMWKLRRDALPAYVEATLSLLQVKIKKEKLINPNNIVFSLIDEYDLRVAFSTALIRFVNLVTSVSRKKYDNLYSSARFHNIPDWIINIRHEAAHSQDLPTLDALFAALDKSYDWLLANYWKKKKKSFSRDITLAQEEINVVLRKAFILWDSLKSKMSLKEMSPLFKNELKEFLKLKNKHFPLLKLDNELYIKTFMKSLKESEKSGIAENDAAELKVGVVKSMLLGFFQAVIKKRNYKHSFLSELLKSSFITEKVSCVSKWQKLLLMVQNAKLIEELIQNLFSMAAKGNKEASKWLLMLYISIKRQKKKWAMYKLLKKENKKTDWVKLKQHLSDKIKAPKYKLPITFDVAKPPTITLDMMLSALLNPETPHLNNLVQYLKLIKPPPSEETFDSIKNLIQLHENTVEACGEVENDKIFTVEDLQSFVADSEGVSLNEGDEKTGWTKSTIDSSTWSQCPMGLLPFQNKVDCDIPEDSTWMVEIIQPDQTIVRKSLKFFTETSQLRI